MSTVDIQRLRGIQNRLLQKKLERKREREHITDVDITDVIVKTVLSQNTNDNLRDIAFSNLKNKFSDLKGILEAKNEEIEKLIRICGLPKVKTRRLKEILSKITTLPYPSYLCEMDEEEAFSLLTSVDGIGAKSAAVILAFGCGRDMFPVDTHVARIMRRTGVVPKMWSREKIYFAVKKYLNKNKTNFHIALIQHGKDICRAKKPKCHICSILKFCNKIL